MRSRIARVDWALALSRVMTSNKALKTHTALARRAGIAQSTVGRILRREVDPQAGNLERIAKVFGLSLVALAQMGEPDTEPTDVFKLVEVATRVALISWAQMGSMADALDTCQPGGNEEWMPRPKLSGDKTFAARVRGESMEPGYQHGDIIFIDPECEPKHGRDVVVRLEDRKVVFRRLAIDDELEYLKPMNPNWPGKIIDIAAYPGARILGTVIGKWVEK